MSRSPALSPTPRVGRASPEFPFLYRALRAPVRAALERWFALRVEGLEHLPASGARVLLLDIQMPGLSGLELARHLCGLETPPVIIFVTAHDRHAVEAFERDYLTRILREHGGNVTHAARSAAKDRRDLGRLLKKYAIDPRLFAGRGGREVSR